MIIPNDIQSLIDRYLDGQTSLEEEDRLADYFRSHDVPEAWQAYKEMFAYFDAGMPTTEKEKTGEAIKAGETEKQPRRHRIVALWTGLTVAAAAALTLFILHPISRQPSSVIAPAATPTTSIAAVTDVLGDTTSRAQRDTVKSIPAAQPVRKKPVRRYRDTPTKPHTYYASVCTTEEKPQTTPADEYMIDVRLRQIEEEQDRSIGEALLRQENMMRQAMSRQAQKTWEMAQATDGEEIDIEEFP